MRSGGFFLGAVGGLALALLLVGVASFAPQTNAPPSALSTPQGSLQAATTNPAGNASAASTTTNGSSQFIGAPPVVQVAGIAPPASSSSTTAAAAGASAPSVASGVGNHVQSGSATKSGAQGQQKPSSFLAVLPGENAGSLIATVSPLFIGLLVATLVYGAYVRRQDSS